MKKSWLAACAALAFTTSAVAVPVVQDDLGDIVDGTLLERTLGQGAIDWYSFTLGGDFTYLEITSNGSRIDTELGLYAADGSLVADDDDSGTGTASFLSFGTGSGLFGPVSDGRDGPISAGVYYLALGQFNTAFAGDFDVDGSSFPGGAYRITFYTDAVVTAVTPNEVPEPGSLALLGAGLAGLALARRRR